MDHRLLKTKKALADALREEMLTEKFDKISIAQICKKAEVSRRNFYRHFLDKRDLLGYIYSLDFDFDFSEHPDWSIFDYLPLFCEVLYSHREFYIKAYTVEGQNSLREYCLNWLKPLLRRYSDVFHNNPEIERRIQKITTDATFDAFVDWLSSEPCLTPEQFTKQYLDTWRNFTKLSMEMLSRIEL